jgi:hypothetical protein
MKKFEFSPENVMKILMFSFLLQYTTPSLNQGNIFKARQFAQSIPELEKPPGESVSQRFNTAHTSREIIDQPNTRTAF